MKRPLLGGSGLLENQSSRTSREEYQDLPPEQYQKPVIEEDGHLNFWVPDYFDEDWLRGSGIGERPARNSYFGHLVSTRHALNGFVLLNDQMLRRQIGHKAIASGKQLFQDHLQINHDFIVGKQSKGYKWRRDDYELAPISFYAPRTVKRLIKLRDERRESYDQHERFVDEVIQRVTLPPCVKELVASLPDNPKAKSESHRRSLIENILNRVQIGDRGFVSKCKTNGRIHCLHNRTPSAARLLFQIDNEDVVEIDNACSQPFFLSCLWPNKELQESVSGGAFYY